MHGQFDLPPGRVAEPARSGRFLSLLERQRIATLSRQALEVRAIANALGCSPSTISRELRRNSRHDRCYDGDLAHARARLPRRSRLIDDIALRAEVQAKLELEWSPKQIAAHLRTAFADRPSWHVCHETIYQGGKGGLSRQLTCRLCTGRPTTQTALPGRPTRSRFITPAVLIDHRPDAVLDRNRCSNWEGDLIVGAEGRSAIGTLVDRASRYLLLVHLPINRRAEGGRTGGRGPGARWRGG